MNYGAEPADQVVRYSLEGMEYSLKITGNVAKHVAIFYCGRPERSEKDKRENKAYQNVKGTAPDDIFYRSG